MKNLTTDQGNLLISRFMGFGGHKAAYHASWLWLMPVLEKIEKLGNFTRIETPINRDELRTTYVNIDGVKEWNGVSKSKMTAVWCACLEFIKWYNKENEKHNN